MTISAITSAFARDARHYVVSLVALLALAGTACNIDPFRLGGAGDGDGGIDDGDGGGVIDAGDGDGDGDAGPPDAMGPDACIPTNPVDICDEQDNDCDGLVDEDVNTDSDPNNCGGCGIKCTLPGATSPCNGGVCNDYSCLPNKHDLNMDLNTMNSNGCEYTCGITNGGVEACDFADNDCNGETDEGFNLDTDEDNCGGCGQVCRQLNATAECTGGDCGYSVCDDGFADLLAVIPGCEYECPVWPKLADEECNGKDDDCDGEIDELVPGLNQDCVDAGFETEQDTGECAFGKTECVFGVETCVGYKRPSTDVCNHPTPLDEDCDGTADEDFDKDNDPNTCGSCSPCDLPNTLSHTCSSGVCGVGQCDGGWVDNTNAAPGQPNTDGCEYNCTPTMPPSSPTGPYETCDDVDNDCDTQTDEDLAPAPAICVNTVGTVCANVTAECKANCAGQVTWVCDYEAAGAEVDNGCFQDLAAQETLCDDDDNDCDGQTDEAHPAKDTACADNGVGICQGTGTYICDTSDTDGPVICNITSPGQTMTTETCNNLDDDCDGTVDNNAPGTMLEVTAGTLWIDAFEASRPDADASGAGSATHRACSNPDAVPWTNVTYTAAAAACVAAGKRLCTEAEWQAVCSDNGANTYPYGDTYAPESCNGKDYDHDCTPPTDEELLPTGTAFGCPPGGSSLCVSALGAFDMSGNVREWTSTQVGTAPVTRRVKGGGFNDIRQGLTCDRSFISFEEDTTFANLGFRCCSDADPSTLP